MTRLPWLAVASILALAACAPGVAPTPPTPTIVALSSPTIAAVIILNRAPSGLDCDSIGWPDDVPPFGRLTFRIEPTGADHVTAHSDTGVELVVEWAPGFEGGLADERVVRDPEGQIVLSDGAIIEVPSAANPELHGYPLCLSPTSVSVMPTFE
jgi:hypothetical protein